MLDTDEKTFEKLFREHYSLLCNYANSIVCNEQAVEDIVQNFFIAVWEKKLRGEKRNVSICGRPEND